MRDEARPSDVPSEGVARRQAGQGIECGEVPQRSHQKGLICPPSCMVFLWVMGTSRGFKLGRDRFKLYCSRMLTQATTGKMK